MITTKDQPGTKSPFVLLVNPWITDFAAYDLWARPLGLLLLGALLRDGGYRVAFVDCLDRFDPETNRRTDELLPPTEQRFGTGKYPKTPVETPAALRDVPRRYYRYGIHIDSLRARLRALPRPDMVWVTSSMTYWYPGVQQTIEVVREVLPETAVWLGGIYARLCPDHAREHGGADLVVTCDPKDIPSLLPVEPTNPRAWQSLENTPSPAFDLAGNPGYLPLLTSLGCPFRCPYCASALLQPVRQQRRAGDVFEEIQAWSSRRGVRNFAFYDDALLTDADRMLAPLLERVCQAGLDVCFHTPNAVHVRGLTPELCRLLHRSGFATLRLGLETIHPARQKSLGGKVDMDAFCAAIEYLRAAGFEPGRIGAYLLCGLPGQSPGEVADGIREVVRLGIQPHLSEYSPIPGTRMFGQLPIELRSRLETEPLLHNNTCFACRRPGFGYEDLVALKQEARRARRTLSNS